MPYALHRARSLGSPSEPSGVINNSDSRLGFLKHLSKSWLLALF